LWTMLLHFQIERHIHVHGDGFDLSTAHRLQQQGAGLLLDFLLPLPDLHWMNPILLADLVDRLYPADGF